MCANPNIQHVYKSFKSLKKVFPFKGCMEESSLFGIIIGRMMPDYLPAGSRILDFGCGPCDKTALYQRLGYECYACDDLNDDWHKEGDNRKIIKAFAESEGIRFLQTSNGNLPYDDEFFDAILLIDIVEHLHDTPRSLLNLLISKLKTNGLVFVGMPNSVSIRKRISVSLGRTNYPSLESYYFSKEPWRGHIREYTLQETKKLLTYQGLSVLYARGVNIFAHHKITNRGVRLLYCLLTRLFPALSEGVLVVARKRKDWRPVPYKRDKHIQHSKTPAFSTEQQTCES